ASYEYSFNYLITETGTYYLKLELAGAGNFSIHTSYEMVELTDTTTTTTSSTTTTTTTSTTSTTSTTGKTDTTSTGPISSTTLQDDPMIMAMGISAGIGAGVFILSILYLSRRKPSRIATPRSKFRKEKSVEDRILEYIEDENEYTISNLSEELGIETEDIIENMEANEDWILSKDKQKVISIEAIEIWIENQELAGVRDIDLSNLPDKWQPFDIDEFKKRRPSGGRE
ncbi:MAG: hypothetical protein JW779_10325, partial [Candidatus Thorarchaeota archaeon]|nr:hypothetical protein [Candidatus Thorarchaeota archaeon]